MATSQRCRPRCRSSGGSLHGKPEVFHQPPAGNRELLGTAEEVWRKQQRTRELEELVDDPYGATSGQVQLHGQTEVGCSWRTCWPSTHWQGAGCSVLVNACR
mmetsp:Transcript_64395/g.188412  ORF Transcript_64395/g.188412 Transcript_64395/m.188412 type:complete len:102 (+) Transcript_64395:297-602(+)